jgi:hypothetical protein
LFQLVVGGQFPVDLGGLLDGGQRVLPRPRSARLADRLFSELARSGRIASGWVLVGGTPRSLMFVGQILVSVVKRSTSSSRSRLNSSGSRPAENNGTLIGGSGLGVGHPPYWQSEPAPIRTASGMEGRSPDELAMPSRVAGLRFWRRRSAAHR